MGEGFCASIVQLDASICCVTRSTDKLLENAQRCQLENDNVYANEEPDEVRYMVRDLTDGYQYELASNRSYYQLTFPVNGNILSVVIENSHSDVVNIADSIARFARTQRNSNLLARERQCLMNRVGKPQSDKASAADPIPIR